MTRFPTKQYYVPPLNFLLSILTEKTNLSRQINDEHKQNQTLWNEETSSSTLEADIFSGIPRDGKQNRYKSRDWDGRGKYLIGSGPDRE